MGNARHLILAFAIAASLVGCPDDGSSPTPDGGHDAGHDGGPTDPCVGNDLSGLGDPTTTCSVSSSECALSSDVAFLNQCAGPGVECDAFDNARIPAVP